MEPPAYRSKPTDTDGKSAYERLEGYAADGHLSKDEAGRAVKGAKIWGKINQKAKNGIDRFFRDYCPEGLKLDGGVPDRFVKDLGFDKSLFKKCIQEGQKKNPWGKKNLQKGAEKKEKDDVPALLKKLADSAKNQKEVSFDWSKFIAASRLWLNQQKVGGWSKDREEVVKVVTPFMRDDVSPMVAVYSFVLGAGLVVTRRKLEKIGDFEGKEDLERFVRRTLEDLQKGKTLFTPPHLIKDFKPLTSGLYFSDEDRIEIPSNAPPGDLFKRWRMGTFFHEAYHRWQDLQCRSQDRLETEYEAYLADSILEEILEPTGPTHFPILYEPRTSSDPVWSEHEKENALKSAAFHNLAIRILLEASPFHWGSEKQVKEYLHQLKKRTIRELEEEARDHLRKMETLQEFYLAREKVRKMDGEKRKEEIKKLGAKEGVLLNRQKLLKLDRKERYGRSSEAFLLLALKLESQKEKDYEKYFRDKTLPLLEQLPLFEMVEATRDGVEGECYK
jgi:hypothetical protein